MTVENTNGWPDNGAAMVGTEVFEFESKGDGTLVVRKNSYSEDVVGRGTRGTLPQQHTEGTPVALLGWSNAPLTPLIRALSASAGLGR